MPKMSRDGGQAAEDGAGDPRPRIAVAGRDAADANEQADEERVAEEGAPDPQEHPPRDERRRLPRAGDEPSARAARRARDEVVSEPVAASMTKGGGDHGKSLPSTIPAASARRG